jgi:hypothetical protein
MESIRGAGMKTPQESTDSLKKALGGSRTFDEANYYKSKQVEMGGEDDDDEEVEDFIDDDDDEEEQVFYGDED